MAAKHTTEGLCYSLGEKRIMCGRYTLTAPSEALKAHFELAALPEGLRPRYNIAPGQEVAVIPNWPERRLELFRWGLVPSWARDPAIGNRMINARAETLAIKPSFRNALSRRRCLVLADGFYEWKKEGGRKIPMYIRLKSRQPFALAGLWEVWRPLGSEPPRGEAPPAQALHTCTIITTTPNDLCAAIHDRMPAILAPEAWAHWLTAEPQKVDALAHLLAPFPAELLEAYAVRPLVNSPANDIPECILPA
jgi:putative SOS response-associated peptidase YedK